MGKFKYQKKSDNHKTIVRVGLSSEAFAKDDNVSIGGGKPVIIAGPCTIENKERLLKTAQALKEIGVNMLRGGAFKPRTNPYSFQGLREEGLKILKEVSEETGLPTVTEVMEIRDIELVSKYTDMLQVGARNSQNFELLKELGKIKKPILLKRGMWQTYEEFLMSAEYILSAQGGSSSGRKEGNGQVILCERGIRTFETTTRNTLDIVGIAYFKTQTHLPIIADPSHATGKRELVIPASKASLVVGADGLIIEASHDPDNEICDKEQTISIEGLKEIINIVN